MIKQRTGNNICSSLSWRMATSPLQLLTEPACNFSQVLTALLHSFCPEHLWCKERQGSTDLWYKPGKISMLVKAKSQGFPWRSKSCLEQRVNSWQEVIKVSFIHSHYCLYVFAIMFIDMFERSTSCSSVQLPVKMGHLSRKKPYAS